MSHADREEARSDGHWGIVGMRERVARAGGTIDVTSAPGGGTVISVVLPTDGV
jgi:signal transduction histidine kinase